ncbi:MAG: diphosphate--fructose-6-phosphate 1-phosphotransferase [Candidatus Micrarchaeia archaeon]
MQAVFSKNDVIVIAQNGGPTPVINRTLVSLVRKLKELGAEKIYGSRFGTNGLLKGDFIDLGAQSERALLMAENTPGSALGTSRRDPDEKDCLQISRVFRQMGATYFFNIGGDNTADATFKTSNFCIADGYSLKAFHLAKTIDNDLKLHYHTPGTGSAMLFIADAISRIQNDLDSMPGKVYIAVTMGKDAGFLAASSSLASFTGMQGPDKIYLPEVRFNMDGFLTDVEKSVSSDHSAVIVVSEGIWTKEVPNSNTRRMEHEPLLKTIGAVHGGDGFGGVTLSGTGALGDFLAKTVREQLKIKEVRADTFGYIPRSSRASIVDAAEATLVGAEAPMHALSGAQTGSVALKPFDERENGMATRLALLEIVGSKVKREMPPEFLSSDGNYVSGKFAEYALPLIGGADALPKFGSLERKFFRVEPQIEKISA